MGGLGGGIGSMSGLGGGIGGGIGGATSSMNGNVGYVPSAIQRNISK